MGTATYTTTENANTAVVRQLVIGVRAKTGSTIPSVATDWPNDAFPTLTFNFPIGATSADAVLTTKPNNVVQTNREFEFYEVSRTPAGGSMTFTTPGATIVDDDATAGAEKYSATTNAMPATDAGGPHYMLETLLQIGVDYTVRLGLPSASAAGPFFRIKPNGVNDTNQQAGMIAADGTTFTVYNVYNNLAHDKLTTAGVPAIFEVNGSALKVTINGTVIYNSGLPVAPAGTFVSFNTNGSAKPTKLTLLA